MRRPICLFLLLILFPLSALSDQLIVEPEMGREPIINAIQDAKASVKIVMYGFTDFALLKPILDQKNKGRTIKIILERYPYRAETENDKIVSAFNQNNIDWQGNIPNIQLIHQKTLIIDGRRAIIMTFNFTHSTFKNERNFALVLDNPKIVHEIESVFDADWHHVASNNHHSSMLLSPENSRQRLINAIKRAHHSIHIYAQNISDYKIIGALANAARKGVNIKILTSAKLKNKQANYLARAGVEVKRSQHYYIHAKAMLIDNQFAIIGSLNLTRASFDNNRELAAITNDATVVNQLHKTFLDDWQKSDRPTSFKPFADKKTISRAIKAFSKAIGF